MCFFKIFDSCVLLHLSGAWVTSPLRGSNPTLFAFCHGGISIFVPNLLTTFALGCDASRLRGFISDFYKQTGSSQNVDNVYCAFVWSVVAQQPEVRVGTVPEGASEVYVAPKASTASANKSKSKSKTDASGEGPSLQASLYLIPDAASSSLDELQADYGDALRIAVDPERSFVAITGSHIRVLSSFWPTLIY